MILELTLVTLCVSLFRDVPLEISKETTYITGPLTKDGRVDYFRALELKIYPKTMKTDENGYRILVRKLGPFIDEDTPDAELFRKQAYEKLGLDPATKPTMTYEEPFSFLQRYVKSRNKEKKDPGDEEMWALEAKTWRPWTLKTMPMMAKWLEKNGPALDVLAEAVRKPEFCRPMTRVDDQTNIISLLLPGIQQTRSFARGLAARANYYIGTGQIDKAIDDVITIKKLGRHVGHNGTLIDMLVGIALEGIGNSINPAGSLEHPPTEAQLKRFMKEIQDLPPRTTFEEAMLSERYMGLDILQSMARGKTSIRDILHIVNISNDFTASDPAIPKIGCVIGFDWNIVARRMNWYYEHMGQVDMCAQERLFKTSVTALGFLSHDTRSEMLANVLGCLIMPAVEAAHEAIYRAECSDRVQRITLAMLLYEKEHGRLPAAYTVDKDGKPMQSWRVLLLPYLGEEAQKLYGQIKLDEPWDSTHNKRFHAAAVEFYQCPSEFYQCPSGKLDPGKTTYSVVVGKKTAFQAGEGKTLKQLGPNSGTMILVIENHTPCNWMDPTTDLTEANVKEVLEKGTVHPGVIMVGLRGGGVSTITQSFDRKKFQQGIEGADRGWLDDE